MPAHSKDFGTFIRCGLSQDLFGHKGGDYLTQTFINTNKYLAIYN
jgi:hypothetical protein